MLKKKIRLIALLVILFTLFLINPINVSSNEVTLYFFWGEGCTHCASQKPYLEEWENKYPELKVEMFETWYNDENIEIFKSIAKAYGTEAKGVPATFIGDKSWIGFAPYMAGELESQIEKCIEEGCDDKAKVIIDSGSYTDYEEDRISFVEEQTVNFFGKEIDVGQMPLIFSTFIISFIDGFNPCSLWVITFLLGIVILSGSRKKIFVVGLTYLTVTALAYGAFMLGLISIFNYVGYLFWIRVLVATIAILFALVNIKDFFWYKKGISFTIPDSYKPKLFKKIRNLMKPENKTRTLVFGSAIMALGITLVELPCTAGFPMIWSNIIATHNIDMSFFIFLFLIYLVVYLSIELIIFFSVVFTLQTSRFEEKHGRLLKLIGGIIMLALANVLVFNPDLLNDIGSTILIFGGSILIALIISKIYNLKSKKNHKEENIKKEDNLEKIKENE